MVARNRIKCTYNECQLPKDNRKYIIQGLFLLISAIFLFKDSYELTFFSMLMSSVPIVLDLVYTGVQGKVANAFRIFYLVLNAILIVCCIVGQFGMLVDNGTSIAINDTAMFFAGLSFNKKHLVVPLLVDLGVPVVMYVGGPTQHAKSIIGIVEQQQGVR